MVALGLILLVVSGAVTLGVVLSNTDATSASAFGVTLSNVSVGGLFLAGVVAGAVLMLGLSLMLAGGARKRARRVETKRTVHDVRTEKEQLEEENAELRARLTSDPYPPGDTSADTPYTSTGQPDAASGRHTRRGVFHK
jgi:membrane protein implicated in regulation of membrane protease activity